MSLYAWCIKEKVPVALIVHSSVSQSKRSAAFNLENTFTFLVGVHLCSQPKECKRGGGGEASELMCDDAHHISQELFSVPPKLPHCNLTPDLLKEPLHQDAVIEVKQRHDLLLCKRAR